MNRKILITYFENFASRAINASKEVVCALDDKITIDDDIFCIEKKELKVSWNDIEKQINEIDEGFDFLILCGEAQSYEKVTIEVKAKNICKGVDKYGISKDINIEVLKDKYEEINTLFEINNFLIKDINFSNNAGSYLCNRAYYLAMKHFKNKKIMFVHFPLLREQGGGCEKQELVKNMINILERVGK